MQDSQILEKILDLVSEEPISVWQIQKRAKIDYRTIKRFLKIIKLVQERGPIQIELQGLRLLIWKKGKF